MAFSCRINGISHVILTKPDVLDGLEEIQVCVQYKYKGERLRSFPAESWILDRVEPQYKKVCGWKKPVHGIRDYSDLPQAFKDYVKFIEDLIQAKISIISTGMERRDSILIDEHLEHQIDLMKIRTEL